MFATGAYHWPKVSGCAKRAHDSRMDTNCRVVITVAKVSAPKALMVWMMNSCPAWPQLQCLVAPCTPDMACMERSQTEMKQQHTGAKARA